MKLRKRWWIIGALSCVLVLLGAARSFGPANDIPAGTGYSAWDLCTRTMQSGEALEHVRTRYVEPKVRPLPNLWQIDVRPGEAVAVSTVLPTLKHERVAIFRKGLGCTIVPPGTTEAELRAQPFTPAPELPADARPWPLGEATAQGALLSEKARAAIDKHAARLYSEESKELKLAKNTTALLVAQNGELVYESYGQGYTREQPQLGWSMTKTVTAMLAGVLQRKGAIDLAAPVGLPAWQGTPKASITWRQLLNMAPGIAWFEGYGGTSDATQMLFSQADQGGWAAALEQTTQSGSLFTYSTGFTNIAMLRMRQLVGGSHQAIYDLYQSELFAPLGIRHGVIEPDASGTPVGGARGMLRPVDWLRLGQLLANGGTWNGATVLTPEHVSFMTAASPAADEYGGFMWREASARIDPKHRARIPDDMVWFAGHLGQFMLVVPSAKLVVLRMGVSIGGSMDYDLARDQTFDLVAELF
jgi:CubicO group peptidase (beta-lactamase class C family)